MLYIYVAKSRLFCSAQYIALNVSYFLSLRGPSKFYQGLVDQKCEILRLA